MFRLLNFCIHEKPRSFQSIFEAVQTLHLARVGTHRPLQSILKEVEAEVRAGAANREVLPSLVLMHSKFTEVLQTLLHFGAGNAAGIPVQVLCCIEKHWSGVAIPAVQEIFRDLGRVSSCFAAGDYAQVAKRFEAVLMGRQTALFWSRCREIQGAICGSSGDGRVQKDLSESVLQQERAMQALHAAFQAATGDQAVTLSTEDLDHVHNAVGRTQGLFTFLSHREDGFETVQRLVQTMASVPGLAFLSLLSASASKKEQLGTRLAELVEGALTPETLDTVEQASVCFMPLCIAALRLMDHDADPRRFQQTVATYWSPEVQQAALQARSVRDLGELALQMLQEAQSRFRTKLPETMESLQSALRQGQVVQHKLQENDDDATAVSNTVQGVMSSGCLQLRASSDSQSLELWASFEFNGQKIYRDMHQLTECADKARLAMPQSGVNESETVQVFTGCIERAIGLRQELLELLQTGHPYNCQEGTLTFPSSGAGLSMRALRELDERLRWARDAVGRWRSALDRVRAECPLISCVPARNAVKLADAGEWQRLSSLVSVPVQPTDVAAGPSQLLKDLFQECQQYDPEDGTYERFLMELGRTARGAGECQPCFMACARSLRLHSACHARATSNRGTQRQKRARKQEIREHQRVSSGRFV